MASHNDKKKFILEYERKFSAQLGRAIMQKPKLSSWMVFIPFIFIFYFQDLSKYKKGRKEFTENYLLSREKALREAEAALAEKREHNTKSIAQQAEIPPMAQKHYGTLLSLLSDHYSMLLKAYGDSYEELVKGAYGKMKNYLTYLDTLGEVEKDLNRALRPELKKTVEEISDLVASIEKNSQIIRRNDAKEFFD